MSIPAQYQTAEGLRTLANYLRSQNGIKVRSGIEHEKRVDYFRGKRLIECVLEAKKWPKSIPKITDKAVANVVASLLVQSNFFHRSEKIEDKKGHMKVSFSPQPFYSLVLTHLSSCSADLSEERVRGERLLHLDVRGQHAVVEYPNRRGHCDCDWVHSAAHLARRCQESLVVS